jgi:hypothetical protein
MAVDMIGFYPVLLKIAREGVIKRKPPAQSKF